MTTIDVFWQSPITHCYSVKFNQYLPEAATGEYVINRIITAVCEYFNRTEDQIRSKTRQRDTVLARQFCMFFLRKRTTLSLKEIGRLLDRDHTTVIHSVNTINDLICCYEKIRDHKYSIEIMI